MATDLLIKNATIIDGSGRPAFTGDIAVEKNMIADIQPKLEIRDARRTIDASGRTLTPGFIDVTSHADTNWSLFLNPTEDYLLTQGVTTILVGNCGSSLAPLVSPAAIESLRKWSRLSEMTINWTTVDEFLTELGKHPLGINVATLIGHGTIRRGITNGQTRKLTKPETKQITELIEHSMNEGAFGLSLGLIYGHEAPAHHDELTLMAKSVQKHGGVMKAHLRSESINLVPAVNELVQIVKESAVPVVISHFKAIGRKSWPEFAKALAIIDRVKDENVPMRFDIAPYQRTGSFLYLLLPSWAREGGFEIMFERIRDATKREMIINALDHETLHYDELIVATAKTANTNGRTIQELADRAGQTPAETVLDLLVVNRGRVTIFGKRVAFKNLIAGMSHANAMIASDGTGINQEQGKTGMFVHPRSSGAFPHFLHRFIKEKRLMSWEEGIRRITALPAETFGFHKRGKIAKGFYADLVIFDPNTIHDRSTYQNPYVHSIGIDEVIVNGKSALSQGMLTGTANGAILRRGA